MSTLEEMLHDHPRQGELDPEMVAEAAGRLGNCAQYCIVAADAGLASESIGWQIRAIRLANDCADICTVTQRMLLRRLEPDWEVLGSQIETCATACEACADEWDRHAGYHDYAVMCATACREAEELCDRLLDVVPA